MVFVSISWKKLVNIICKKYWYKIIRHDKTSHIIIQKGTFTPISIPSHKEIKEWLLNTILKIIANDVWTTKREIFKELFF